MWEDKKNSMHWKCIYKEKGEASAGLDQSMIQNSPHSSKDNLTSKWKCMIINEGKLPSKIFGNSQSRGYE